MVIFLRNLFILVILAIFGGTIALFWNIENKLTKINYTEFKETLAKGEVVEVILTGGHYAAQEVAKNLLPLMDEISISYYQSLLEQMPEKTKKYRLLKNTVKQYKLHLQGG